MDTRLYHLDLTVTLIPVYHREPPMVKIWFNHEPLYHGYVENLLPVVVDKMLEKSTNTFSVEFLNKRDTDTVNNKDKAIIIDSVKLNKISDLRFVWQGVYEPCYPEPWASEQRSQGIDLDARLKAHTYMSWNGKWSLTFDLPIFTWIHRIQNLGWIYD